MRNDRRTRKAALWISTVWLGFGVVAILLSLTLQVKAGEALICCDIDLNDLSKRDLPPMQQGKLKLVVLVISVLSVLLGWLQMHLHRSNDRYLMCEWIIEPLGPWADTSIGMASLILSLAPSLFSKFSLLHYLVAWPLVLWAFFLQVYLQPWSNFAILSTIASASFSILTSAITCIPKNAIGMLVMCLGFALFGALCVCYARAVYSPHSNTILLNCEPRFQHPQRPILPQRLKLDVATTEDVRRRFFLKPHNQSFEMIPYLYFDQELIEQIRNSGNQNYYWLDTVYVLNEEGPLPSFPSHTPSLPLSQQS